MKRSARLIFVAVLFLGLAGAGCSGRTEWLGAAIDVTRPSGTSVIQAEALPPVPTEEAVPSASSTPLPSPLSVSPEPAATVPPKAKEVVKLAVEDLAGTLKVDPDAITILSVESVEWSDTSLGCPEPDKMYAQVITPGFLVTLEVGGTEYSYHTDESRFVVLCPEGQSTQP